MSKRKTELLKFLVWMRNGTAFCTTWFLILILVFNSMFDIPSVSTNKLINLILLSMGGVFLFNLFFTCLFIKSWSFTKRLTGFMIGISIYECFCFYSLGIFQKSGSILEWIIFIGIVLVLYFCCIAMYQQYSKKQGELYTRSLQVYQEKRRIENGE